MSLSSAYAIGDVLGLNHSPHCGVPQAKGFYAVYALLIAGAATIVLIPGSPLGLLTEGVQVLAGVQLGKLRLAGLVSARREGRYQIYTADDPHILMLVDQVFAYVAPGPPPAAEEAGQAHRARRRPRFGTARR